MTSETKRDDSKGSKGKKRSPPATKKLFVVSCLFCDQEKIGDDPGQQATVDEPRQRKAETTDDSDVRAIFPLNAGEFRFSPLSHFAFFEAENEINCLFFRANRIF